MQKKQNNISKRVGGDQYGLQKRIVLKITQYLRLDGVRHLAHMILSEALPGE